MKAGLLPVRIDEKTGYIDVRGTVVVEPRFDGGEPFSDGLAWVKRNGRWGAIDGEGGVAIPESFTKVFPFVQGFSRILTSEGFGFVDRSGDRVGDIYPILRDFARDGLAFARTSDNESGYLGTDGAWALPPKVRGSCGDFGNGLAWFEEDERYGYIDPTGQTVIEPQFERASDFDGDVAAVSLSGKLALIDRRGEVVARTRTKYRSGGFGRFTEGIMRVSVGNASAWIDESATRVIEAKFGFARDFVGPYAQAGDDSMHQGLIDRSGAYTIPPRFFAVIPTPEGPVRVFPDPKKPGTYGYVTATGAWIWKPPGLAARWDDGGYLPGCR